MQSKNRSLIGFSYTFIILNSASGSELFEVSEPADGGAHGGGRRRVEGPRTTGKLDTAVLVVTIPDANRLADHFVLEGIILCKKTFCVESKVKIHGKHTFISQRVKSFTVIIPCHRSRRGTFRAE
jgi:hypothetical protein